jgi:hypothetical protein
MYLPIYLLTHPSINLLTCLTSKPPTYHLPTYLPIYLPTHPQTHPSTTYLPTYLPNYYPLTYPFTYLPIYLPTHPPTHPHTYLPIHPPTYLLFLISYNLPFPTYHTTTCYLPHNFVMI